MSINSLKVFRLFVLLTIACLLSTGMSFAVVLQGDFVGAWLFDEGNGLKAKSLAGKVGDGSLNGGAKWVPGKISNAISFDGKDGYVEMSLPEIFNNIPNNSFTITYWLNAKDIAGSGTTWTRILEARNDSTNYLQFDIQINNGELGINLVSEGTESTFIVNTPIIDSIWYYVTGTWDAKQKAVKLYLNGVLQTGKGTTPASPGDKKTLNIGRRSDGTAETYFEGIIDEFAILSKALTEDEIKSLMKDGLKPYVAVLSLDKLSTMWGNLKSKNN
ncbi:MAG: LamG domain-containing protein [Candidatus Poribacteria bacterium]